MRNASDQAGVVVPCAWSIHGARTSPCNAGFISPRKYRCIRTVHGATVHDTATADVTQGPRETPDREGSRLPSLSLRSGVTDASLRHVSPTQDSPHEFPYNSPHDRPSFGFVLSAASRKHPDPCSPFGCDVRLDSVNDSAHTSNVLQNLCCVNVYGDTVHLYCGMQPPVQNGCSRCDGPPHAVDPACVGPGKSYAAPTPEKAGAGGSVRCPLHMRPSMPHCRAAPRRLRQAFPAAQRARSPRVPGFPAGQRCPAQVRVSISPPGASA